MASEKSAGEILLLYRAKIFIFRPLMMVNLLEIADKIILVQLTRFELSLLGRSCGVLGRDKVYGF